MTVFLETAAGKLDPRFELGDIVIPAPELSGDRPNEINAALAELALREAQIALPRDQSFENGVIIPADGFFGDSHAAIRGALASLGIGYAICGISPPKKQAEDWDFTKYHKEAIEWETTAAPRMDTSYLEQIFVGDEPESALSYITARTIYRTFADIFDTTSAVAAATSAGKIYTRIAKIFDTNRHAREHLLYGTAYFGDPIKSSAFRYNQSQWGILPAALYGMTLETGKNRAFGFGEKEVLSIERLLEHIQAVH